MMETTKEEVTSLREMGLRYKETRSEADFTALYERVVPGLRSYVCKMTTDDERADHVVSKTMETVHLKIEQYDPKWNISTWIYRIAYQNFCLMLRRERGRKPLLLADAGWDRPRSDDSTRGSLRVYQRYEATKSVAMAEEEEAAYDPHAVDVLPSAVQQLPESLREVILARFYENKRPKEIAAERGVDRSHVMSELNEAKRILRRIVPEMVERHMECPEPAMEPVYQLADFEPELVEYEGAETGLSERTAADSDTSIAYRVQDIIRRAEELTLDGMREEFRSVLRDPTTSASKYTRSYWLSVAEAAPNKRSLAAAITNLYLGGANLHTT